MLSHLILYFTTSLVRQPFSNQKNEQIKSSGSSFSVSCQFDALCFLQEENTGIIGAT